MIKDSAFARGTGMTILKMPAEIESMDFSGRAFEILQYLSEAENLTVTMIAELLGCGRNAASKSITSLWHAHLARCLAVATPMRVFRLWTATDGVLPRSATEACRLAALGMYYTRARKEVQGFEWRLVRNGKKPVCAEMTFIPRGKTEKAKMLIEAPRRGEEPGGEADLYIFPTLEEGQKLSPRGKRFTADLILLENKRTELNKLIFEIENGN
ncbi:MAG: hypothetical protein K6T80_07805 [Firmicutes bacterium]|nr:hypothetical protein [Bacillota bacterium]